MTYLAQLVTRRSLDLRLISDIDLLGSKCTGGPQLLWYTLGSGLFCPLEPYFEGWRNVLPAI